MLQTATIGELMRRDVRQASGRSRAIAPFLPFFPSTRSCIEMYSRFQYFFFCLFFSFSLSLSHVRVPLIHHSRLFHAVSLFIIHHCHGCFLFFVFFLFIFELFPSPLAGFHCKCHSRPLTPCVFFFSSIFIRSVHESVSVLLLFPITLSGRHCFFFSPPPSLIYIKSLFIFFPSLLRVSLSLLFCASLPRSTL